MQAFGKRNGLAYGLLGLPLAFVALPLYVILPNYYAKEFGVPLAILGAILLGARLFDAFIDPLLGRFSDQLFKRSANAVLQAGVLSLLEQLVVARWSTARHQTLQRCRCVSSSHPRSVPQSVQHESAAPNPKSGSPPHLAAGRCQCGLERWAWQSRRG